MLGHLWVFVLLICLKTELLVLLQDDLTRPPELVHRMMVPPLVPLGSLAINPRGQNNMYSTWDIHTQYTVSCEKAQVQILSW